jgi:uncharacterized protein (DUF1501 family)
MRLSRRAFLGSGAFALGGLAVPDLLRLRAAETPGDDTAVILVWLPGGPPHLETYDPKPDAPAEYRGAFHPIDTVVPGVRICELLPRHARIANKFALIRSIHHGFADHGGGHKHFLTGREPREPAGFVNDHPMVGSVVAKCREGRRAGVPDYVAGTDTNRDGIDVFSFGSAYLGQATHPFSVVGDPSRPDFRVRNLAINPALADRLDDRSRLLGAFDRVRRDADRSGVMDSMDEFGRRAVELLTSVKARDAFDLSREPDAVRERYGRHPWGQRALLARRLVEAGSSWVTMVFENPMPAGTPLPKDVTYNWDSHAVNCHIFEDAKVRLPHLDQAVTALIEDIHQRGLDRRVLLVVTGEFGRTPRIEQNNGRPGRDHWPQAMSVLVSGGGLRMGQVVGSTDARGERPKDRPLTPCDLWATVYQHLGIDPERTFPDHTGRPMPILPHGSPIRELIG